MAKSFVRKSPEDKKKQIKEITDKLDAEISSFVNSDKFKNYLKTMSKFHDYSFSNTILIAMQKPDATFVSGFRSWETNFNRHVKKGEKGIKILAPSPVKKMMEREILDPDTKLPVMDDEGKVKTEKVQVTIPNFHVVTVFDISSTEGEELPTIGVDELTGRVNGYTDLIAAVSKVATVPVEYAAIDSGAKGYYSPSEKKIVVKEGMSELQTLKTLIHETAHNLLHDKDGAVIEGLEDADKKSRNVKEIEAEAVAFTCVEYINDMLSRIAPEDADSGKTASIDTSEYSFPYISSWIGSTDLKELKASMDTIRKTASHIITGIEDFLKERSIEKSSIKDRLVAGKEKSALQSAKVNIEKGSKELMLA